MASYETVQVCLEIGFVLRNSALDFTEKMGEVLKMRELVVMILLSVLPVRRSLRDSSVKTFSNPGSSIHSYSS